MSLRTLLYYNFPQNLYIVIHIVDGYLNGRNECKLIEVQESNWLFSNLIWCRDKSAKKFNWSCLSVCREEVKTDTPTCFHVSSHLFIPQNTLFSSFIWLISRTIEAEPSLYLNCSLKLSLMSEPYSILPGASVIKEGVLKEKNNKEWKAWWPLKCLDLDGKDSYNSTY